MPSTRRSCLQMSRLILLCLVTSCLIMCLHITALNILRRLILYLQFHFCLRPITLSSANLSRSSSDAPTYFHTHPHGYLPLELSGCIGLSASSSSVRYGRPYKLSLKCRDFVKHQRKNYFGRIGLLQGAMESLSKAGRTNLLMVYLRMRSV